MLFTNSNSFMQLINMFEHKIQTNFAVIIVLVHSLYSNTILFRIIIYHLILTCALNLSYLTNKTLPFYFSYPIHSIFLLNHQQTQPTPISIPNQHICYIPTFGNIHIYIQYYQFYRVKFINNGQSFTLFLKKLIYHQKFVNFNHFSFTHQ